MKINIKLLVLIMGLFLTILNCNSKDVIKNMYKYGLYANYKDKTGKESLTYTILYKVEEDKKTINFYTSRHGEEGFEDYILVDKVVYDEKKKTISFYKPDGLLIIILELVNNNEGVRIIDYGKWLNSEDFSYKPTGSFELYVMLRFSGSKFYDSSRIYKL